MSVDFYQRVGKVTIRGRAFSFPPLDFEFEVKERMSNPSSCTLRLYNPAEETVSNAEPKLDAGKLVPVDIEIDAGYTTAHGISVKGGIIKHKYFRDGLDRVLELSITDNALWTKPTARKSYLNTKASAILKELAEARGGGSIRVGEDRTYPRTVVGDVMRKLESLAADTKSAYIFRNGELVVVPVTFVVDPAEVVKIDFTTGLLEYPRRFLEKKKFKKTKRKTYLEGYELRCLFMAKVGGGSSVEFETTSGKRAQGVVAEAVRSFSTFGEAQSILKVKVAA